MGDADLRSARILLEADPPLTTAVCFHSRQAAEKYLKSFLVHHNVEPTYTHSQTTLLGLCVYLDASLNALSQDVEALSPFAVQARYPARVKTMDVETARSALQAADAICKAVRARLREMK